MRFTVALSLGLLILPFGSSSARADWGFDASGDVVYDDNLTRAQDAVDKRSALATSASASASNFIPFDDGGLTFSAHARAEAHNRYRGLDNLVVGGGLAYRRKFGVGYAAPWLSISIDGSHAEYRDDLRTSTYLNVQAEAGQRLTDRFDTSAAVFYGRRYNPRGEAIVPGIPGDVFALAGQGAYARIGYAATNELYLDAKASVRRGDVESTAQESLQIFLGSGAIAPDPVWGDPELYAYRLRGTTLAGAFTASYALSDHASLNATYQRDSTRAAEGLKYSSNATSLTFVYRF